MNQTIRQAVVLAGGKGTRLGTLTTDVPKPMLDVAGRPFIEWVVANLERQGVEDVILTVGYRAAVFEEWANGFSTGPAISLHVEDEPLDTGGALLEVIDRLDERFFVLNGDTLLDVSYDALSEALNPAHGRRSMLAVALRHVDDAGRFGRAKVSDGWMTVFAEKSAAGEPGLINGGVYAMRRDALADHHCPLSIERTLIPELVEERRVTALPCDGFFIDIGVPDTYRDAQRLVPAWWDSVQR